MSSPGYSLARLRPRRAGLRFTRCVHLTNGLIQLRSSSGSDTTFLLLPKARSVDPATVRGRRLNLPREVCRRQKSAEGIVDLTSVRLVRHSKPKGGATDRRNRKRGAKARTRNERQVEHGSQKRQATEDPAGNGTRQWRSGVKPNGRSNESSNRFRQHMKANARPTRNE